MASWYNNKLDGQHQKRSVQQVGIIYVLETFLIQERTCCSGRTAQKITKLLHTIHVSDNCCLGLCWDESSCHDRARLSL